MSIIYLSNLLFYLYFCAFSGIEHDHHKWCENIVIFSNKILTSCGAPLHHSQHYCQQSDDHTVGEQLRKLCQSLLGFKSSLADLTSIQHQSWECIALLCPPFSISLLLLSITVGFSSWLILRQDYHWKTLLPAMLLYCAVLCTMTPTKKAAICQSMTLSMKFELEAPQLMIRIINI